MGAHALPVGRPRHPCQTPRLPVDCDFIAGRPSRPPPVPQQTCRRFHVLPSHLPAPKMRALNGAGGGGGGGRWGGFRPPQAAEQRPTCQNRRSGPGTEPQGRLWQLWVQAVGTPAGESAPDTAPGGVRRAAARHGAAVRPSRGRPTHALSSGSRWDWGVSRHVPPPAPWVPAGEYKSGSVGPGCAMRGVFWCSRSRTPRLPLSPPHFALLPTPHYSPRHSLSSFPPRPLARLLFPSPPRRHRSCGFLASSPLPSAHVACRPPLRGPPPRRHAVGCPPVCAATPCHTRHPPPLGANVDAADAGRRRCCRGLCGPRAGQLPPHPGVAVAPTIICGWWGRWRRRRRHLGATPTGDRVVPRERTAVWGGRQ